MHGLTSQMIQQLINKEKLTEVQIAEMYGTTRQNVNKIKLQDPNWRRGPRQQVREWFPFEVNDAYTRNYIDRRLRDHGEYMITNGKDMDDTRLTKLREFYNHIIKHEVVVVFDPDLADGTSTYGGYLYQARTEADNDWLIRWNDWAIQVPQEGVRIWRLPRQFPKR